MPSPVFDPPMAAGSSPRALIVEDEPAVSTYLRQELEELGYEVQEAGTFGMAMGMLKPDYSFDVAFIDLGLPDRSGLELITEVQRLQPYLPVVWATGYGHMVRSDMSESLQSPVLLTKPYNREAILVALNALQARWNTSIN